MAKITKTDPGWISVDVSDEEIAEVVKKATVTKLKIAATPVPEAPPVIVEEPLPVVKIPDLPFQDLEKLHHHPYIATQFTIDPVDISDNTVSDKFEFKARKIVDTHPVKRDGLVIVCSTCGRISSTELCPRCFPHGLCKECFAPIQPDGVCWSCNPFGVCELCGTKRIVPDLCWSDYCQNQQMTVRCSTCNHPVGGDGKCVNAACVKSLSHPFACETASCRQYCVAKVDNEDEGSEAAVNTRNAACKLWDIHQDMAVHVEAMNFYTAWSIARYYEDEEAVVILNKQVERLTREFADYFELAIGGELRHTMVYNSGLKDNIPKWLRNEFPCCKARPCAWLRWKGIRDEYGISALRDAVKCFKLPKWPGSYGGNNWATIAQTLLDYREGHISPIAFVDLAFSLEHNCGCAFNKVYNVNYLREVLNICQDKKDPMELLKSSYGNIISTEIKKLVKKYEQKTSS